MSEVGSAASSTSAAAAEQARARQAQEQQALQAKQAQQQQQAQQPAPGVDEQQQARAQVREAAVDRNERARPALSLVPPQPALPAASSAPSSLYAASSAPSSAGRPSSSTPTPTPQPSIDRQRRRAQQALDRNKRPDRNEPYRKHIDDMRKQLAAKGLPTKAPGVRIIVNDPEQEHGAAATRGAAGHTGPGQGADIRHQDSPPETRKTYEDLGLDKTTVDRMERAHSKDVKNDTIDGLVERGVSVLEGTLHEHRAAISRARGDHAQDPSKPTVLNMSWGMSVADAAESVRKRAMATPAGSPIRQELKKALGFEPNPQNKEHMEKVDAYLRKRIQEKIDGPGGDNLRAAKKALGDEALAAEKEGVHIVAAAGNEEDSLDDGEDRRHAQSMLHGVPGMTLVGATGLGRDPKNPGDDDVSDYSSNGAHVAAPGTQSPIEERRAGNQPKRGDGTSYASPYVAGVMALMLQANPDLTPAEVRQILQDTARKNSDPRAGAGVVDPVAAVERARQLRSARRAAA